MGKQITLKIPYREKLIKKDKEYIIDIVPNRFTVDYGEYMQFASEIIELNDKRQEATDRETLLSIQEQMGESKLQTLLTMKYGLIKTMMKSNGYDYDPEFWDERVDPNDVNRFITSCMLKDKDLYPKKKVTNL